MTQDTRDEGRTLDGSAFKDGDKFCPEEDCDTHQESWIFVPFCEHDREVDDDSVPARLILRAESSGDVGEEVVAMLRREAAEIFGIYEAAEVPWDEVRPEHRAQWRQLLARLRRTPETEEAYTPEQIVNALFDASLQHSPQSMSSLADLMLAQLRATQDPNAGGSDECESCGCFLRWYGGHSEARCVNPFCERYAYRPDPNAGGEDDS